MSYKDQLFSAATKTEQLSALSGLISDINDKATDYLKYSGGLPTIVVLPKRFRDILPDLVEVATSAGNLEVTFSNKNDVDCVRVGNTGKERL